MTTLQNILDLNELQSIKVLAGNNGTSAPVSTITVLEIPDVKQWTGGGELIITSLYSIRGNEDKQLSLIKDMIALNCSGLAIKRGPYSTHISTAVLNLANKNNFTILELPNDMLYVDFIMPSMNLLLTNKNMDEFREKFIHDLLFDTFYCKEAMIQRSHLLHIDLENHYFQAINLYLKDNKSTTSCINLRNQMRFIFYSLSTCTQQFENGTFIPTLINDMQGTLVIEWTNPSPLELDILLNELNKLCKYYFNDISTKISIGSVNQGYDGMRLSYENAVNAYETGVIINSSSSTYNYDQTKLLCSICSYIKTHHHDFIEYQNSLSNKELLNTLVQYYKCNENLEETAQFLFTHKNTVKYRLQKIANITGLDYRKSQDNFLLHFIVYSVLFQ